MPTAAHPHPEPATPTGGDAASAPGPSLTDRATAGFAFFAMQTAAFKGASLVGQVVLAYLLSEGDFGLFALCGTVAAFIDLLQQGGLREVLIRRQRSFRVWANAAFWMSLSLGLLGAALMAGSGPLMAAFYGDPALVGLLAVLAVTCPLNSLNTVPMARLQIQLRFKLLATVAATVNIGQLVLTVLFAALGLGAFSFVLARVVTPVVQALIVWPAAAKAGGIGVRPRPQVRRWKHLFTDSALLIGTLFFYTAVAVGDRAVLGRWADTDTVGLYAFALFISIQTIQIVTSNLEQIFFPTLSSIQDDGRRQIAAFLRASRILALVAVPACLFQAALSDPLIRLVFEPKWYPAIPAAEILSLGMLFLAVATPAFSLMRAQGRFRTLFVLAGLSAGAFIVSVLVGVRLAGEGRELLGVAAGVAVYQAAAGVVNLTLASRPTGIASAASDVGSILAPPLLAGALAIGGTWALSVHWAWASERPIAQIALVAGLGGPLYLLIIRVLMPGPWRDLLERAHALLARLRRRPAPTPPAPDPETPAVA